jgi:membrane protein HdeD
VVETRNLLMGVFAIILGILVISFPLMGVFTFSIIDGTVCLVISLWIIMHSIEGWNVNKTSSIAFLVLGIIGFIFGLLILGNINVYSFFFGITFYLAGLIILIAGLLFIFLGEDRNTKLIGIMGTIAGVISIIMGYYSMNPYFVALIIGIVLIIYGIYKIIKKN